MQPEPRQSFNQPTVDQLFIQPRLNKIRLYAEVLQHNNIDYTFEFNHNNNIAVFSYPLEYLRKVESQYRLAVELGGLE